MFVKFALIFLVFVKLLSSQAQGHEIYSQTVYLYKFGNPITQDRILFVRPWRQVELYSGVWLDYDRKTNSEVAYTDAQVSPLAGFRTNIFGPSWLLSRGFAEGRYVYRLKSFPDDRPKETYDLRGGLLGYGLSDFSPFFFEQYYALFYTRLYGERVIFQGWSKQGIRIQKNWDLFNEFFGDTFDFTRDNDPTFDLRPGLRFTYAFTGGSVQVLHQYLYHFTNLDYSGRNEQRSTLIFGIYW